MTDPIYERHKNERLTDNTKIKKCVQCKDCKHWGNTEDYFTNAFDKSNCDKFPIPGDKPSDIFWDKVACPYKETR